MSRNGKTKKEARDLPFDLPQLPFGWCWSSVEQVAEDGEQPVLTGPFGSSLGREDFIPVGVPLLTIGCLTEGGITLTKAFYISETKAEFLDRYRVRPGDLLFSRSASVGRAGLVTEALEGSVINYHLMRLRLASSMIDPRLFIYYVRGSSVVATYLREVNHGATRDGINTTDLLAMPVAVPPLKTQRRIVAKIEELFSNLDAGVAALERAKANLKRYRAAILKAAVEGKLTEEWRTEHSNTEPASKLLARSLVERRKKWEADQLAKLTAAKKEPPKNWKAKYVEPTSPDTNDLPELPDTWCWTSVEQCASYENFAITDGPFGSNLKTEHYTNEGPHVIRLQNIGDGSYVDDDAHISEDHFLHLIRHAVKAGDIVTAMLGEKLPRACLVPQYIPPAIVKADCVKIAPNRSLVLPEFLLIALNSHPTRVRASSKIAGVGRPRLNLEKLRPLAIPIPALNEQRQIVADVAEKLSQIEAAEVTINHGLLRAARLRQSILKQAFEGNLVPQDPKDEPAGVLMERIKASRLTTNIGKPRVVKRKRSKQEAT